MRWLIFLGCFLLGSEAWAAKPALISDASLQSEIKKIELFEKQEKYLQAQKAYEGIFKKYALSKAQLQKLRKQYESLNLRMIFSKVKIPGTVIHTVKEGEGLFVLAKKYKTTMEAIRKINRLKSDEIQKGMKLKIINGRFEIKVDKSDNILFLYFNDKLIKRYPVTTGAKNKTPVGKYRIINKVENPTWYFEEKVIPPGSKKNLLGTRWMGFDKQSYGIHGTVEPEAIGKQASLGCVRMLNRDVEEVYDLVALQTKVTIID